MEFEKQDIDIVRLLAELKDPDVDYPLELMTSRRQGFVKQIAALTGVAATSAAIKAEFAAFINRQKVLNPCRTISSLPVVEQIVVNQCPGSAVPLVDPALIDTVEPTETTTEMS